MLFRKKVIKVVVCEEDIQLPMYATPNSFAMDIRAAHEGIINAGEVAAVGTGIYMEIPKNYGLRFSPRSGLSLRKITLANPPSTIDSDFRGEVKLLVHNQSRHPFKYEKGERLAQCYLEKRIPFSFKRVVQLTSTVRGDGGFGHTGKK